ncbi:MAG TPA: hypothetical protein VMX13_00050 [Sedimentisphaerales bacterium]|nr:hypothetical protein [Sedimentisphaerales bacterium]
MSFMLVPNKIDTGCHHIDEAWAEYSQRILESSILIADENDDLNWHAFLGHSVDMQGFRAAEFSGADALSKPVLGFRPLKERGIGVSQLANLWDVGAIRRHLLDGCTGTGIVTSYKVLRDEGGEIGASLAEAFETFPFRKGHKYIRALLQNSAKLADHAYNFRDWLKAKCEMFGVSDFPPKDFRRPVGLAGMGQNLEEAICKQLEKEFFMVGPEIAPYMICDWQLWLWKEAKTGTFDSFKLDAFHAEFVDKVNLTGGVGIPKRKADFTEWWYAKCPNVPVRMINECIWLFVEDAKKP